MNNYKIPKDILLNGTHIKASFPTETRQALASKTHKKLIEHQKEISIYQKFQQTSSICVLNVTMSNFRNRKSLNYHRNSNMIMKKDNENSHHNKIGLTHI